MIKNIPSSEDSIRTALSTTAMTILTLTEKLAVLEAQELIPGSSDRRLEVRITCLRSRYLLKYFAVDQEFNLVRSYTFDPGGLMKRGAASGG